MLAVSAYGQSAADVRRLLDGPTQPVKVADLPDGLRAVVLDRGSNSLNPLMTFGMAFAGMMGGAGSSNSTAMGQLFSLMDAILVNPDEFAKAASSRSGWLKGYRMDFSGMMVGTSQPGQVPEPIFTEVYISGAAIDVWSVRSEVTKQSIAKLFQDLAQNNAATAAVVPAMEEPNEAAGMMPNVGEAIAIEAPRPGRQVNFERVTIAVMDYSMRQGGVLPNARSWAQLSREMAGHVPDGYGWESPSTGSRILFNTRLAGKNRNRIRDAGATLLLWEETPDRNGYRYIARASGRAYRVDSARWERIWADELSRRAVGR
jgi:hypothetical protein